MRVMVTKVFVSLILIIVLLMIQLSTAEDPDFTFKSPESVGLNQEFSIEIRAEDLPEDQSSDVKVFVSDTEGIISETYNNKWQSSFYYIQDIFPDGRVFNLRVLKSPGSREICLRIRQHEKTKYEQVCNDLEVWPSPPEPISQDNLSEREDEVNLTPQIPADNQGNEVILLNSPSISNELQPISAFIASEEKTIIFVLLSFALVLVLIVVLLILRKL